MARFPVLGRFLLARGAWVYAAVAIAVIAGVVGLAAGVVALLLAPLLLVGRARRRRRDREAAARAAVARTGAWTEGPTPAAAPRQATADGPAGGGAVVVPLPVVPRPGGEAGARVAPPPGRSVLVAGGDAVWRGILRAALEARGCAVIEAAAGRLAAPALRRHPAGIAVLRIETPVDDLEAAAGLGRSFPGTRVIALCRAEDVIETARVVGPHNVLVEPALPHVLCEEVDGAPRSGSRAPAVEPSARTERPARRG